MDDLLHEDEVDENTNNWCWPPWRRNVIFIGTLRIAHQAVRYMSGGGWSLLCAMLLWSAAHYVLCGRMPHTAMTAIVLSRSNI